MIQIFCDSHEIGMEEELLLAIASKRECSSADSFHLAVAKSRFDTHTFPLKSMNRKLPLPTFHPPAKVDFDWKWMRQVDRHEQVLDRIDRFTGLDIAESFRWKAHVFPTDYIDLTMIIDNHANFVWYEWICSG